MFAVYLVGIFLVVSYLFTALGGLSEFETTGLTLYLLGGLIAVVLVAATMIMSKLNSIHKLLEESKNKDKKSSEFPENKEEKS